MQQLSLTGKPTSLQSFTPDNKKLLDTYEKLKNELGWNNWVFAKEHLYTYIVRYPFYYHKHKDTLYLVYEKKYQPKLFCPPMSPSNNDALAVNYAIEKFGIDEITFVPEQFECNYKKTKRGCGGDYIYDLEELTALSGQRYKKIRNKINKFINDNIYRFRKAYSKDENDIQYLLKEWKNTQGKKYFRTFDTIEARVGTNYALEHNIPAYVVEVDGHIRGFITGNKLMDDTAFCFIGKTDVEYKGLSDFIMVEFYREMLEKGFRYGNDGSGVAYKGLHDFKDKYRPIEMLENYTIKLGES